MTTISVHSVLYHSALPPLERAVAALNRAAEHAFSLAELEVSVRLGDASPVPVVTPDRLELWRDRHPALRKLEYDFFGENLGHGGGQNRLGLDTDAEFVVFSNPDIVPAADSLLNLWRVFEDPAVGIVEGKQLPLEHPKDYDAITGATSWASGAFSMIRTALFRELGGFDHHTFFLHGDDVDLSWRARALGWKVVYQPAAVGFHDKRFGPDRRLLVPDSERYHSAESALLLAYKWSREDVLSALLERMRESGDVFAQRAVRAFDLRSADGRLPDRLDPLHATAEFVAGNYATHRW